jgi:hypothetical protein
MTQNDSNRRTFLKTSTAAATGAALTSTIAKTAHAAGSDTIRFVLIGCGGRGGGAAAQIMNTKGNVKLVAVADPFEENAKSKLARWSKGDTKDKLTFLKSVSLAGWTDTKKQSIPIVIWSSLRPLQATSRNSLSMRSAKVATYSWKSLSQRMLLEYVVSWTQSKNPRRKN